MRAILIGMLDGVYICCPTDIQHFKMNFYISNILYICWLKHFWRSENIKLALYLFSLRLRIVDCVLLFIIMFGDDAADGSRNVVRYADFMKNLYDLIVFSAGCHIYLGRRSKKCYRARRMTCRQMFTFIIIKMMGKKSFGNISWRTILVDIRSRMCIMYSVKIQNF